MSNGPEFFQTPMGRKFYEGTMPKIAEALADLTEAPLLPRLEALVQAVERIAAALERIARCEQDATFDVRTEGGRG